MSQVCWRMTEASAGPPWPQWTPPSWLPCPQCPQPPLSIFPRPLPQPLTPPPQATTPPRPLATPPITPPTPSARPSPPFSARAPTTFSTLSPRARLSRFSETRWKMGKVPKFKYTKRRESGYNPFRNRSRKAYNIVNTLFMMWFTEKCFST